MMDLPRRVDWDGNAREASSVEVARAEGTASRIRSEVAEIRTAAERLSTGNLFEAQVAAFLMVQATILERHGGTPQQADLLHADYDTREDPNMFPTAGRSALLIARAYHAGGQQSDRNDEK